MSKIQTNQYELLRAMVWLAMTSMLFLLLSTIINIYQYNAFNKLNSYWNLEKDQAIAVAADEFQQFLKARVGDRYSDQIMKRCERNATFDPATMTWTVAFRYKEMEGATADHTHTFIVTTTYTSHYKHSISRGGL